jgi:hypothetical protein
MVENEKYKEKKNRKKNI